MGNILNILPGIRKIIWVIKSRFTIVLSFLPEQATIYGLRQKNPVKKQGDAKTKPNLGRRYNKQG